MNGKLVETSMNDVKTGTTSTGEFYTTMKEIFDPQSETEFHWDHWAKLGTRKMAVFNYFIDLGHSQYRIGLKGTDQEVRVAYRGLIYADPMTGEIDRIKMDGVDIPKSFPVNAASETLDYDLVSISGQQFVLPLSAKLMMKAGREATKNEIEFRMYRKFESDSFIKYNLDPNAPSRCQRVRPMRTAGDSSRARKRRHRAPAQESQARLCCLQQTTFRHRRLDSLQRAF